MRTDVKSMSLNSQQPFMVNDTLFLSSVWTRAGLTASKLFYLRFSSKQNSNKKYFFTIIFIRCVNPVDCI